MRDPTTMDFLIMWRNGGAKFPPVLGLTKKTSASTLKLMVGDIFARL
jgi:hypothetical protein